MVNSIFWSVRVSAVHICARGRLGPSVYLVIVLNTMFPLLSCETELRFTQCESPLIDQTLLLSLSLLQIHQLKYLPFQANIPQVSAAKKTSPVINLGLGRATRERGRTRPVSRRCRALFSRDPL